MKNSLVYPEVLDNFQMTLADNYRARTTRTRSTDDKHTPVWTRGPHRQYDFYVLELTLTTQNACQM